MSSYVAAVEWTLDGEFARGRYSRAHRLRFDGGIEVAASASPSVVPRPWSVDAAVDPEELLVAAIASCHMLSFLDIARRAGCSIERYEDAAEGVMEKTAEGRLWLSRVLLRPKIAFVGPAPSAAELEALHHKAHDVCFIANSVKTEVRVAAANETPAAAL
jgi:organic hydroperoxide reductase OsmC/OhrA